MIMKPKLTRAELTAELQKLDIDLYKEGFVIVGWRGYYKNTLGKPNVNDRGIYDDAIFVISDKFYVAYQANTDPAKHRRGIATLIPGVYDCVKWKHHGKYWALQIIEDRLKRDGIDSIDVGRHGINIHYGSETATWSEGCQTLRKSDWEHFQPLVYDLMKIYKKNVVKYVLIEK